MSRRIRVLHVVGLYPTAEHPSRLVFVKSQVDSLAGENVECGVHVLDGQGVLKYAFGAARVRKHLDERPADLIHAHFSYCGWVARGQGRPVVISFLGSDVFGPRRGGFIRRAVLRRLHRSLARSVAERAAAAIVKSEQMRRVLDRPADVVPNGVDLNLFSPVEEGKTQLIMSRLGLDPSLRYVLFAGAPDNPVKQFDLAREAVTRASSLLNEPLELLPVYGRPQIDLVDFMRVCNLLLLTSAHEGSPNVIKEAMACNLPIVSVDVGDVRERIHGTNGSFVTDDADSETIAHSLCESLRFGRRSNGRERIRHLSLEAVAQRIRQIYDRVLANAESNSLTGR